MRHDTTIELVTQLNELTKYADGSKRPKLHRLIKKLIAKATTADDVLDKDGNIIKEGTGDLSAIQEIINRLEGKPADRTSTATMRANQLGLWFASFAYVLLCGLRRVALHHTKFANATCGTIRLQLLKIGALVRISVRRIKFAMASGCPAAVIWGRAAARLNAAASARASPA